MSRRRHNFSTKVTHFFKRHFGSSRSTSSSSNADVPPAGPPPPLQPATLPHIPPPVISPPQPPTPPTFQPAALPPPTPPQPLQSPQRPADCEMVPSHAIASSLSHDTPFPPKLLHSLPVSGPTPNSSLPSASRTPTPQFGELASFAGAHNFVIKDPSFIDISLAGSGLKELLKHSMPDAFHNSAARYPPPKCHLGTREEYITKITDWALGKSNHGEPILWMRGPFGIGKSAVAQSCAEVLQRQNKLAATLFFSRSNADRDDPRRVFTSIAYQIATICEPFSNIVDARIRKDPALATKSLSTQFEELLMYPLSQIGNAKRGIEGRVVIIDGLDECRGLSEQCEIIDIIAAHNQTTPFRWFITSRPEEHIIQTMNSDTVSPASCHLELPVSRDIDHEILVYLVDEFAKIRKRHRLPDSWPSEQALTLLVDRTAGLWIYVTTIIRFVTDKNSFGPEDQLRIVLEFAKSVSGKVGADNPLAEMDLFYMLIMRQVPQKIITTVRKILLLYSAFRQDPERIAAVLCLSKEQFRRSCASLQSVMELQGSNLNSMTIHFYHASFLDFMEDPERSKELCIHGDFLIECRRERLDWLHQVCSRSTGPLHIIFPSEPLLPEGWNNNQYYSDNLYCFWDLCTVPNHPFDLETTLSLGKLQFRMMFSLVGESMPYVVGSHAIKQFRNNLPTELHDKIIRNDKCPTPGCTSTENVWILGYGENEAVVYGHFELSNNQDPRPGQCFCGSSIKRDSGNEPPIDSALKLELNPSPSSTMTYPSQYCAFSN